MEPSYSLTDANMTGRSLSTIRSSTLVPIASCALSAATLATLGSMQAGIMLAVPVVALFCPGLARPADPPA